MALADPQSINIGGTTYSLPRVSTGDGRSEYASNDGIVRMTLSNAYGKRTRRVARVDFKKISADPFLPSTNVELGTSVYVVWDSPRVGFTPTELLNIWHGLQIELDTTVGGVDSKIATQLLGGES